MCDPFSMLVAGSVISGGGQIMGGMAANASGKANQAMYEAQAYQEQQKAKMDIATEQNKFRRFSGTRNAIIAASGADAANFSEVFADDFSEHAREVAIIKQGGNNRATNLRNAGAMERARGQNAQTASFISAAGTFAKAGQQAYSLK